MFNIDVLTNGNNIEHNLKWPYIPDYPYRMLISRGSGSGKTNVLLNLISHPQDIDKIKVYTRDLMNQNISHKSKNMKMQE